MGASESQPSVDFDSNTNCYAHAFGVQVDTQLDPQNDRLHSRDGTQRPQPGFLSSIESEGPANGSELYDPSILTHKLLLDWKSAGRRVREVPLGTPCSSEHQEYPVILAVDNQGEAKDYHFLKGHLDSSTGQVFWTHKRGSHPVENFDASGRVMQGWDVTQLDLNYDRAGTEEVGQYHYFPQRQFCVQAMPLPLVLSPFQFRHSYSGGGEAQNQ